MSDSSSQLLGAPDELREAPRPRLQTGAHVLGTDQLEQLERLGQALDHATAERPRADVAFDQRRRRRGHERRPRCRHLLHAAGDVGRLADRGVIHAEAAADGADDDFTRIQTDPHMDGDGVRPVLGEALHGLMHAERRVAGAQGVILLGEWGTEERHDSVPHHLVDRALVPVDGLHHPLENGVQERPGLLGVPIRQQLQRPLEIGEEHGDLLALAFEGRSATQGSCPRGNGG